MSNRRDLKAYVRYDGTGRIVPSSLILSRVKPKVGNWQETAAYECCNPAGCASGGNWGNFTGNFDLGILPNAATSTTDSSCNVYKLSKSGNFGIVNGTIVNNGTYLEKFSSDGTLIWQKLLFWGDGEFAYDNEASSVHIGVDGNLYVVANFAMMKLSTDGTTLWAKYYNTLQNYNKFSDTIHPSSGRVYFTTMEYVPGDSDEYYVIIGEINPATGDIINSTRLTTNSGGFTPADTYLGFAYTWNGNDLFCSLNAYNVALADYKCMVFKMDVDLNIIWTKSVDVDPVYGYDIEVTQISVDGSGNIFISMNWDGAIAKLDSSGNILWSRFIGNSASIQGLNGQKNIIVDSAGNSYAIGNITIPELESSTYLYIAKFDPSGNMEFVYGVYSTSSGIISVWPTFWNAQFSKMVNDVIFISAFDNLDSSIQFKLPLTQVIGTYGIFAFIDLTPYMVITNAAYTTSTYTLDASPWTPFSEEAYVFNNVDAPLNTVTYPIS